MERGGWRPSPLTVGVTLVVAAVAVLGFVLTNRSVASQNQALLKSDTTQAAVYVSSIVSTVLGAPIQSLASDVTLTNASPADFEVQAKQASPRPAPSSWPGRRAPDSWSWPPSAGASSSVAHRARRWRRPSNGPAVTSRPAP